MTQQIPLETHPWPPFVPDNARVMFLGTFPPKSNRWSMDFFYPNPINDFWRVMGTIFFGDPQALWYAPQKRFNLPAIKQLLCREGIAMGDTASAVRRLRGNASDKFLEIVDPIDLTSLLRSAPALHTIVTTGEKAAGVLASLTNTEVPRTGEYVDTLYAPLDRPLRLWRMPSTSRAYPKPLAEKVNLYAKVFEDLEKFNNFADK